MNVWAHVWREERSIQVLLYKINNPHKSCVLSTSIEQESVGWEGGLAHNLFVGDEGYQGFSLGLKTD